jgi:hypothetical protein
VLRAFVRDHGLTATMYQDYGLPAKDLDLWNSWNSNMKVAIKCATEIKKEVITDLFSVIRLGSSFLNNRGEFWLL